MLRAFFSPFGKICHAFLPLFEEKTVANISRQNVTLLHTLYLLSPSLARVDRKYVLIRGIDDIKLPESPMRKKNG